ncbi:helix-turn-helix domain-containing protein [Lyngbya sp. CCY1209]|jgi:transcriptional regulator with XRE-family HTH domain|uniref:helix-turn-helix domain-containing protein n=1 Tax=Lyngbya sp. CCY1209 TaxID=2886103 RepID=UPI002D205267|nr:helix-turn-helix domain-containing protein [Lyngbya sp. CCY1209]MEB3884789.1 helix-turn-helix domain-containing protein [Lyngbya sp. CCY1209]
MSISEQALNDIPTLLRTVRHELGLSQSKLAQRLGVSSQTINRWENGHSQPSQLSMNVLKNQLNSLDIPPDLKPSPSKSSLQFEGLRQADVARILNVSFQRVQTIRKRHYMEFTWDKNIQAWVTSRDEVQRYIDNKGKRRRRTIH